MILTFKQKRIVMVGVLYYLPEHQHILQTFHWQTEDFVPDIPRVQQFLEYWKNNIEATIKEVVVSETAIRTRYTSAQFYKVIH
jgi:uncharacterized protein Usg